MKFWMRYQVLDQMIYLEQMYTGLTLIIIDNVRMDFSDL